MEKEEEHITLNVKDLAVGYSSKKEKTIIANNINFNLYEGEFTAIIGANGIGKSTLLRTLGTIQPSLSGEIDLNDQAIEKYNPLTLAAKISLVLTEPIAAKSMTVIELVALGRSPYTNWLGTLTETDTAIIEKSIKQVELNTLRNKKCNELSDGQLQRVMIARALAQDTAIILLDEPTTHLDLYHKVQILKLLKTIAKETKKTIVFTTHEIEMAIQMTDKILILDNDSNPFGSPKTLIREKSFEKLFPADTVVFNADTNSFKIR
ncbi:ABC transporter ATP-binding protein [Aurantibacter sp.]|uniref:ABC transporter ATP-binding protein n=1 Tax=Aurantibacter sp. TaxID=2807103 RepID=UPI00326401B0